MNNFGSQRPRRAPRQAIDGILNAPVNQRRQVQPVFKNRLANGQAPRRRVINDFGAVEGFHSANRNTRSQLGAVPSRRQAAKQPGLATDHSRRPRYPAPKPVKSGLRRRGSKKQRPTWKKLALRGSLATVVVIVALGGFLVTKGYLSLNSIFQGGGAAAALDANVDPSKLRGEGDGRVNIMLLGRGGSGHDGPDLTDTLLVASIDPVNKQAALLSVPRDLWVQSRYGNAKINALFANAKTSALRKNSKVETAEATAAKAVQGELEDILGINMHYYSIIDFAGFEKAVNTVGGITINVPQELRDPTMAWENNRNPVLAKKGVQKMDGKKALMYVRSRHGTARGDFDRSERQRLFLMALKSKLLSSGTYSNPVKLSKLMGDFGDHARTDFSLNDLSRLYSLSKGINDQSIASLSLADPPNDFLTTGAFAGQSIVRPKDGLYDYSGIQRYVRTQLPDGYIKKENARIVVLNGTTTAGLGNQEASTLKEYGYRVGKVDNTPTPNYSQTVIVDLNGKDNKYTRNYLEKRYKVKVTKKLPTGITVPEKERKGFVIIVGNNETLNS